MTSTKISIVCAKPLPAAVEPQPVKKEPVMADGVCRTDGAAVDLKGGVLELLNAKRPTINAKPADGVQPAIAAPDANAGVTVGGTRNQRRVAAPAADATPGDDATPAGGDEPPVAATPRPVVEPSMSVTGNDVVVAAPDGRLVPEDGLSANDKQALNAVRATPDSSGDAIITPNRDGLVTAMDAVLAANPELVTNAAANDIDKARLAQIIADTLWPTAQKSEDGRYAVSLPTYPGAYSRMLQDYIARRPGTEPAAILGAADAVAQTAIEAYVAQDIAPSEARTRFHQAAIEATDANAAYYARPEIRATLAEPAAADRFRPYSEWTPEQRRALADGVDRCYSAAGYDPADEEPLYYDESYAETASFDALPADGVQATALRTARSDRARADQTRDADRREAIRTGERRATFASYVTTGVQLQGNQQAALRVAERNLPLGASLHPAFIRTTA